MNILSLASTLLASVCLCGSNDSDVKAPSVFISILVRNKAHTLPYFLSLLDNINYPKDRITLYIRSHHNSDASLEILEKWLDSIGTKNQYHNIIKEFEGCKYPCLLPGENSPVGWNKYKFTYIMNSRQRALNLARVHWADYFWNLDSDVFLLEPDVLKDLVSKNVPVVAPLLTTLGQYSNFWGDMNDDFYYARSDDYSSIRERKKLGCHNVALVHSSQLIDLRTKQSDLIAFHPDKISQYPGPQDDLIVFALSCKLNDISMYVCNDKDYGMIMLPLDDDQNLQDDFQILRYVLLETTSRHPPIKLDPIFVPYLQDLPEKHKLGVDEIYMINLERRTDRRERMEYNFDLLGIDARYSPAVDGRDLTASYLQEQGISMLPGFSEPYHDRPLKLGEIGCFMSHFNIWQDMITSGYETILVLEDDIRFEPYFIEKFEALLDELQERREDWDLAFIGRKILHNAEEWYLEGTKNLVYVDYTHWTLGYLLTQTGARKLIQAQPLGKMVPVDEFIPIMYDRHPNSTWASHFPVRNLKAISASPRLIFPTHYTGEEGYISDTEDTSLIKAEHKEDGDNQDVSDNAETIEEDAATDDNDAKLVDVEQHCSIVTNDDEIICN